MIKNFFDSVFVSKINMMMYMLMMCIFCLLKNNTKMKKYFYQKLKLSINYVN